MRRRVLIFTLLAILAGTSDSHAESIPWRTGWKAAQAESKHSGKPLMISVGVDWSGWCSTLNEQVYPDLDVIRAANAFVPIRLDGEHEGRRIAAIYAVRAYPTILFVDVTGRVIYRMEGFEPADKFAADLDRVAKSSPEERLKHPRRHGNTFTEAPKKTNDSVVRAQDAVRARKYQDAGMMVEGLELTRSNAQMGPLYNDLGDAALAGKQFAVAMHWFQKTLKFAKDPDTLGYAHLQTARCYLGLKQIPQAQSELKFVIKLRDVSPHVQNKATEILGTIAAG